VHILIQRCRALCKKKDSPCENLGKTLLDWRFQDLFCPMNLDQHRTFNRRGRGVQSRGARRAVSWISPRQGTMPVSGNMSEEKLWRESLGCF
jgi:hypothetical protein